MTEAHVRVDDLVTRVAEHDHLHAGNRATQFRRDALAALYPCRLVLRWGEAWIKEQLERRRPPVPLANDHRVTLAIAHERIKGTPAGGQDGFSDVLNAEVSQHHLDELGLGGLLSLDRETRVLRIEREIHIRPKLFNGRCADRRALTYATSFLGLRHVA